MRVHRTRSGVRDPERALLLVFGPALCLAVANIRSVGTALDGHAVRHIEELETHVSARQRVVIVLPQSADRPAIGRTHRGKVGAVDR